MVSMKVILVKRSVQHLGNSLYVCHLLAFLALCQSTVVLVLLNRPLQGKMLYIGFLNQLFESRFTND